MDKSGLIEIIFKFKSYKSKKNIYLNFIS